MLVMHRLSVAQGLVNMLKGDSGVSVYIENDYSKAADAVRSHRADAALIEITESARYDDSYCLALCSRLRKTAPGCRLVLLCPEKDEAYIAAVVKARQNDEIDDFIFYDASLDYMASKLI